MAGKKRAAADEDGDEPMIGAERERKKSRRRAPYEDDLPVGTNVDPPITNLLQYLPPISEPTSRAISELLNPYMTENQAMVIPLLLEGKDVVGTGAVQSSKDAPEPPLHILIPLVELLYRSKLTAPSPGIGAIVICPTTAVATKFHAVAGELLKYHYLTCGLVLDASQFNGVGVDTPEAFDILVGTPKSLLERLLELKPVTYEHLKCVIFLEADMMLDDLDDKVSISELVKILPEARQVALFCSIYSLKVKRLRDSLHMKNRVYVDIWCGVISVDNEGARHAYAVVESENRFIALASFLTRMRRKKVIVHCSSSRMSRFLSLLLKCIGMDNFVLFQEEDREKRRSTLSNFAKTKTGILISTIIDGLCYPNADWVVLYDSEKMLTNSIYVFRFRSGKNTLIFLLPHELPLARLFKAADAPLRDMSWLASVKIKLKNRQPELEKMVAENPELLEAAEKACIQYVFDYIWRNMKDIFDINLLNLHGVASSFCLPQPITVKKLEYLWLNTETKMLLNISM